MILSPHLDDAILSCGGALHRWWCAGDVAVVVTAMTADPPEKLLSPFAEHLHSAWHVDGREAYGERRRENAAALARVGARGIDLGLADCIYRGHEGKAFYNDDAALFGDVDPLDAPLTDTLLELLAAAGVPSGAQVYAPLAIGGHVDHVLVRRAAEAWRPDGLSYYEDMPYAAREIPAPAGAETTSVAERLLGPRSAAVVVRLSPRDISAKIVAIGRYRSQVAILFGRRSAMSRLVRTHAARVGGEVGYGERFWSREASPALAPGAETQ